MKKTINIVIAASIIFLSACDKDKNKVENPQPVEQELITTIRLHITGENSFDKTFSYKVENGFGTTSQGNISVDTLVLPAGKNYSVDVKVLNEKTTPAEDITTEVIEEKNEHLFLFQSQPATGAGAITFSDGSKDENGLPFNQSVVFHSATAGSGKLVVTLKHQPTDKNAPLPENAGGETDAEATFPVRLQ